MQNLTRCFTEGVRPDPACFQQGEHNCRVRSCSPGRPREATVAAERREKQKRVLSIQATGSGPGVVTAQGTDLVRWFGRLGCVWIWLKVLNQPSDTAESALCSLGNAGKAIPNTWPGSQGGLWTEQSRDHPSWEHVCGLIRELPAGARSAPLLPRGRSVGGCTATAAATLRLDWALVAGVLSAVLHLVGQG